MNFVLPRVAMSPSVWLRMVLAVLGLFGAPLATAEPTTTDAQTVVENLHATLISVMTDAASLGFRGRYERLAPVLEQSFDFPAIARIVNGRYWRSFDAAAQADFIRVFSALSTATYATNFAGFNGERFVTLSSEDARGRTLVRTELVKNDGDTVSLNYLLRQVDGAWRIVNVIAQGVSDLALKRAEYTAVIQADGAPALIAKLEAKVTAMAAPQ